MDKMSSKDMIQLTSQYTVARMLERDDFEKRFKNEKPISIHEFLYPLVQAYDSVQLKADIEMGGTDQRFNLLVGRDIQKDYEQKPQCILTLPLLEGIDGVQKMSKSYGNYISLQDTPKDMFGKTMRISDELMFSYYKLLTDLSTDELEQMKKDLASGSRHPKKVKISLAKHFVTQFYGRKKAEEAEAEFERIFQKKGLPNEIPVFQIEANDLGVCVFLGKAGLASSNTEARRLIEGGAVSVIEGQVTLSEGEIKSGNKIKNTKITFHLKKGDEFILKVGKKKFSKVKVV